MIGSYLKNRLTESKLSSKEWVALAQVLEEFWQLHFNKIDDFEADKNIFTASNSELEKKIRELGDYFDVELPFDDSTKRLSIAWQRDRIHQKNTLSPFILALKLNFAGLPVEWNTFYCRGEYNAANFITDKEIADNNLDINDYWLTSRGRITIESSHLNSIGMTRQEFKVIVEREIRRLKPTHIVYDGIFFVVYIELDYLPLEYGVNYQFSKDIFYHYSLVEFFDEKPSDEPYLDFINIWSFKSNNLMQSYDFPLLDLATEKRDLQNIFSFQSLNMGLYQFVNTQFNTQFLQASTDAWVNQKSAHIPIEQSNHFNEDQNVYFDQMPSDFITLDVNKKG